jgi:hypothetical protein
MLTNLYGKVWPEGAGKLEIELMAFKLGLTPETGGLGKFQHFKNVVEILWPYHKTRNNSVFMLPVASLSRFFLLVLRFNPTERLIHGSPSQSQEEGLV